MARRIIHRAITSFATIYIIITISFIFVRFMPGNPLIHLVGEEEYYYLLDKSPEILDEIAEKYGLNNSLYIQYAKYIKSVVTLDFGRSYINHKLVVDNVTSASKWTLMISIPVLILGGLIGCITGTLAGWKPDGVFDKISTPIAIFFNTMPTNCTALILLIIFSYKLKMFPLNGMVSARVDGIERLMSILHHLTLPLTVLVLSRSVGNYMLMKSSVSQVRHEEYVLTAISKGLKPRTVIFRHIMKNALPPYLTSICMQMGGILSGSMVVEVIFGWKGMGKLFYDAVQSRDFPTAQLCFIISAVLTVGSIFLSDILNAILDPRIRETNPYE
jgi:ABC-type dipeptide/oligopeptide/nickel transport systems, permease components